MLAKGKEDNVCVGSFVAADTRIRDNYQIMECSRREIHKQSQNMGGNGTISSSDTLPSRSCQWRRHEMERKVHFNGSRLSFYGILWLVTMSCLPLACSQPIALPPTVSPTVSNPPTSVSQPPTANTNSTTAPAGPNPPSPSPSPMKTPPPTVSLAPTATSSPTLPPVPTGSPTNPPRPTRVPTIMPTITPRPTGVPSASLYPSTQPSTSPSAEPTFSKELSVTTVFNQRFQIGNELEFNETEQVWFCETMEGYTGDFGGRDDGRVNTTCLIISQRLQIIGGRQRALREGLNHHNNNSTMRRLQGVVFNQVEYSMTYSSNYTNVTSYPTLFQNYVNADLDRLTTDLQNARLAVTNSFLAFNNIATLAPTTLPTITPRPTIVTPAPVATPTALPSAPFVRPPNTPDETAAPSMALVPTVAPAQTRDGAKKMTAITSSVIAAFAVLLVGLFIFYRQRKKANERKFQAQAAAAGKAGTGATVGRERSRRDMRIDTGQPYDTNRNGSNDVGILSPADSLRSKDSLISAGPSPLSDGSEREDDATSNLADEFDQYKDKNLEKMRLGVEDNLTGFDGMMSQALTKAIMGDDDAETIDLNDLRWGGTGDSIEIEATALYEVTDWVKRKESATQDERGGFMQETLDRMVASVRHGVMDPECGSRAIHECAAILGLQLASKIPGDTLIVSGMPKWVSQDDLRSAFSEFGEIDAAAVAANRRGFGLVRFKSPKGVSAAMSKYRMGEIVVQDVAVMIKVLKSDDSDRRSGGWPESGFPPPTQNVSRHSSRAASPVLK